MPDNQRDIATTMKHSQEVKLALEWFYGLQEEERFAEWQDWEKRQKRFHRPQMSCNYLHFCIHPIRFIHAQWIHRERPML